MSQAGAARDWQRWLETRYANAEQRAQVEAWKPKPDECCECGAPGTGGYLCHACEVEISEAMDA